ncbi:hypothetical protein AAG906_003278 [Vitis piasezkii]
MILSTRVRVRVNNESEKDKGLIPSLPLHSQLEYRFCLHPIHTACIGQYETRFECDEHANGSRWVGPNFLEGEKPNGGVGVGGGGGGGGGCGGGGGRRRPHPSGGGMVHDLDF